MKKNRRRVLFRYSSNQFDTGSPKSLVSMIDMLKNSNYEPLFLATGEGPLTEELISRKVPIIQSNVRSLSVKKPLEMLTSVRQKSKLLKELSVDLVHINEFGWNQDIALAARTISIPVVLHCRNATTIRRNNLNRIVCKKILAVSGKLLSELEASGNLNGKGHVLYNAVDIGRYSSAKSIRENLGFSKSDVLVCTIAQVCHRKGIDVLINTAIKLLKNNPSVHFLIVGPDGKDEADYATLCKTQVKDNKIENNIHFLGSRTDIPEILNSIDVFFLPTRYEPFGRVITEAMAASAPIVASRVGGIPEIVDSPKAGVLIDSEDVDLFHDALLPLVQSPEIRNDMGQEGYQSLFGRFDMASIRTQLLNIYDELSGIH